jgi:hypothetical protein
VLVCASGPVGANSAPLPPTVTDLVGARGLSLSGYLAMPQSNDGIFVNPAGLAARHRYSLEGNYLLDRVGADTDGQWMSASVVDSQSTGVTGGFAYTRLSKGPFPGWTAHLALAAPLTESFFVGVTGKYVSLDGPGEQVRTISGDVGAFWQVMPLVTIAAAGYNLLPAGHRSQLFPGVAGGIGLGSDRGFQLSADYRANFVTPKKTENRMAVGAEFLLADMFPIRAGVLQDDRLGGKFWSAGAGIVTSNGVALDLGYRQQFDRSDHRTLAVTIKFFLFTNQ